jgi:hypothetical protein
MLLRLKSSKPCLATNITITAHPAIQQKQSLGGIERHGGEKLKSSEQQPYVEVVDKKFIL